MASPVVHWEIAGRDLDGLATLYGELFGWTAAGVDPDYRLVDLGEGIGSTESAAALHWALPPLAVAPFAASIDPAAIEECGEPRRRRRACVRGPGGRRRRARRHRRTPVMSLLELAREAQLVVVGARGAGGFAVVVPASAAGA